MIRMLQGGLVVALSLLLLSSSAYGIGGGRGGISGGSPEPTCTSDWEPYGFVSPQHAPYDFGAPSINTKNFLGLSARGNVVIGDYRNTGWQDQTMPNLLPAGQTYTTSGGATLDGRTQPYTIDASDVDLGYQNDGYLRFDGNYTQPDGEMKTDNTTPRHFYEATLSDAEFGQVVEALGPVNPMRDGTNGIVIDGVLYTNHAIAGYVNADLLDVFGAMVARDDGLAYGQSFRLGHDPRLLDQFNSRFGLPMSVERPQLIKWEEIFGASPTSITPPPPPPATPKTKGGSSVLCTELFRQGALPKAWFLADAAYGLTYVAPSTMAVYHAWGIPLAQLLHHSRVASAVAKPFILAWAQHMAYVMGATDTDSPAGHLLTAVGLPIHRALGNCLKQ